MRRLPVETLENRRLLANVLPAFADKIGLTSLIDTNTTFEDNFDGTSLDRNKWQVRYGPRWRKVPNGAINEMSWTGEESILVRNGNLELIAHTDPTGRNRAGYIQTGRTFKDNNPDDITDARLLDGYNGDFEQAYGYWESRVKFTSMPGQWSAFWVHSYGMVDIGDDATRINKPEIYGTEYDVAEHSAIRQGANVTGQIGTVAHANGYERYQRSNANYANTASLSPSYQDPSQFHVYGMLWTPTYVKMYIDGNLVHTETDPAMVSKARHGAIFSNDIGAGGALFPDNGRNWFGYVPAGGYGSKETSNAKLTADYIRVWQLKGPTTPGVGSVGGVVFNDKNYNGVRDADEVGLAGRTVYVDANRNGALDAGEARADSNANGDYVIGTLTPGSYVIRQVNSSGSQTVPASVAAATVTITGGQRSTLNFGIAGVTVVSAAVEGRVIRDANANGVADAGEAGVASIPVYLDYDGDSTRDADEPQVTSSSTGAYRIVSSRVGSYPVRLALGGTDFVQTFPAGARWVTLGAGQTSTVDPFGVRPKVVTPVYASVAGTVYTDTNRNGIKEPSEAGRANVVVYVDLNFNGRLDSTEPSLTTTSTGAYRFDQVTAGAIAVRIVQSAGMTQTQPPASNGAHWLTTVAGMTYSARDFGLYAAPVYASVTGAVFLDANANGKRESSEAGVGAVRVYLDSNLNGRFDAGEPNVLTSSGGVYAFHQVPAGTAAVRIVPPANHQQTVPANNGTLWVAAGAGQAYADRNFGIRIPSPGARIAGAVFHDVNANGRRDTNEAGVAGIRVYLDANLNAKYDAGETSQLTAADGSYVFQAVPAGTVAVRVSLESAWRQVLPASNGSVWIASVDNGHFTGREFGIAHVASPASTNTISGGVFGDWNQNGARDAGENGIAGLKVYLDYNMNGKFDAGEPIATTSSTGAYTFTNVRAGPLAILMNLTNIGWLQTYPLNSGAIWATFTSGMNLKDRNFMVKTK